MTINIGKKQLTIGIIVLLVALLAVLGIGALKNASYMKKAKQCQKDIHQLNYMSSLLCSELHDVWSDYILEDKEYVDRSTGKFYKYSWGGPEGATLVHCSNFSRAIEAEAEYYEGKGINKTLDSLYSSVKALMTKMTPAPKKYAAIHSNINALFHTAEAMYNCATSPEGSLRSYTETINSLSADYKRQSSQVDIEIGELDEDEMSDKELELLLKFVK